MADARKCAKCNKLKDLEDFSPGHYRCRPCRREDSKEAPRHGMSFEEYLSLLEAQGGRCAICGKVPEEIFRLVVDHDHECCPGPVSCGKCVRGILCHKCNTGLGMFDDNLDILQSAVKYLARGGELDGR